MSSSLTITATPNHSAASASPNSHSSLCIYIHNMWWHNSLHEAPPRRRLPPSSFPCLPWVSHTHISLHLIFRSRSCKHVHADVNAYTRARRHLTIRHVRKLTCATTHARPHLMTRSFWLLGCPRHAGGGREREFRSDRKHEREKERVRKKERESEVKMNDSVRKSEREKKASFEANTHKHTRCRGVCGNQEDSRGGRGKG